MARYYKPAQGNIRDGGIFQPDWELAQKAFLQKDEDMSEVVDTLSVLGVPTFDYNKQADQAYADEVASSMEGDIDAVTREIMGDIGNASKNRRALANLRSGFEKSAESGDIYKLGAHKQAIDEWQKKVGELENISEQQKYGNYLNRYYSEAGGSGARDNPFNSIGVVSQDGMSFSDFTSSDYYKALTADENGMERTNTNGVKMMLLNNKLVELTPQRLAEAYQGWLQDNPDAMLRAQIGEQYLGEQGQWLNEEGRLESFRLVDVLDEDGKPTGQKQIEVANTIPGLSLLQGLKSIPYKKDYRSEVFQKYELQYEKNLEFNRWRREQEYNNPTFFGPQVDSEGIMQDRKKQQATDEYINRFHRQITESMLVDLPVPTTPEEVQRNIQTRKNYKDALKSKFGTLESIAKYAKEQGLETIQGEALRAIELASDTYSYNKLNTVLVADGKKPLTAPQQKRLKEDTDVQFKNQINNGKMEIELGNYVYEYKNEKGEVTETFNINEMMDLKPGEKLTGGLYSGQIIFDPNTRERVKIKQISYKEGSAIPNFMNSPGTNGRSLSDNPAIVDLLFEVETLDGREIEDPLIFGGTVDMGQKNGGVSFPNVFD